MGSSLVTKTSIVFRMKINNFFVYTKQSSGFGISFECSNSKVYISYTIYFNYLEHERMIKNAVGTVNGQPL